MIRKDGPRIIISCNGVGCYTIRRDQDGQPAKFRHNRVVWAEAQAEGWTSRKQETVHDYDHFCPTCSRKAAAA